MSTEMELVVLAVAGLIALFVAIRNSRKLPTGPECSRDKMHMTF